MENKESNHKLTNSLILKLNSVEDRLELIESRNKLVEENKAWEVSKYRVVFITFLTYVVIMMTMKFLHFSNPFTAALIPALGYFLSTLSLGVIRRRFIDKLGK